jgi:histone H3/H4
MAMTALKLGYKGEIHRLRVDLVGFELAQLQGLFEATFGLGAGSFVVQYTDPEGDCVNVTSDDEFAEACRVFQSGAEEAKALRFTAVSRTQIAFQENVTEPILKALEKLVETLNAAMDKVKHEQWAQKAQTTAQTGLDHTNEALRVAAKEARDSLHAARQTLQEIPFDQIVKDTTEGLNAARQSLQEIPFDQLVKDTTDGLKSAAEGISDFAKEVVGELKNYNSTVTPAVVPAETAAQEVVIDEAVEIAPRAAAGSDSEWEEVSEHTPAAEVAVAQEVEVEEAAAPVVSEEELKWATELSMIRDFLPSVEAARVIDRLEQCNGNVEVVVNAFMEEM